MSSNSGRPRPSDSNDHVADYDIDAFGAAANDTASLESQSAAEKPDEYDDEDIFSDLNMPDITPEQIRQLIAEADARRLQDPMARQTKNINRTEKFLRDARLAAMSISVEEPTDKAWDTKNGYSKVAQAYQQTGNQACGRGGNHIRGRHNRGHNVEGERCSGVNGKQSRGHHSTDVDINYKSVAQEDAVNTVSRRSSALHADHALRPDRHGNDDDGDNGTRATYS